jgi:hypothetical protein
MGKSDYERLSEVRHGGYELDYDKSNKSIYRMNEKAR